METNERAALALPAVFDAEEAQTVTAPQVTFNAEKSQATAPQAIYGSHATTPQAVYGFQTAFNLKQFQATATPLATYISPVIYTFPAANTPQAAYTAQLPKSTAYASPTVHFLSAANSSQAVYTPQPSITSVQPVHILPTENAQAAV